MTTFALAVLFVWAFIRVTLAALAREHVRLLHLEYKRHAAAVLPRASEVEKDAAEADGDLHHALHR